MESELSLITKTLKHCGFESRQNDLFGNEINFSWGKNVFKGLKVKFYNNNETYVY
jgi:hypothetical protein